MKEGANKEGEKLANIKFGTQEYYDYWAKTMNEDKVMNDANMTKKWAYIFIDKIKNDGTPLTFIATWDHGKVSVEEGNSDEPVDFKFKSDYKTWAEVTRASLNPLKATITGKFEVEGSFSKITKDSKALGHMAELAKNLKDVEY